jgi:hypothetical protein
MGFFLFEEQPRLAATVKAALRRRGLEPDATAEWEVHGPHQDMNYEVYIGPACERGSNARYMTVVIYPRAVYEIEDGNESKWWDVYSRNLRRIPAMRRPVPLQRAG